MRKALFIFVAIVFCFSIFKARTATAEEPIRFSVTDVVGLEELQREFHAFQAKLTKFTGKEVKLFPVTGRTVVVEALKSGRLDFALTGPAEYIVITKKTAAKPVIGLARPNYHSVIITMKKTGLSSLDELKGKKVGFGDYGSTSYHLAPMQILADSGINPTEDIKSINVNKNVAWKSLIKGDLDAIGMNASRFELFSSKEKNVTIDDFKILARGPQLPSDLIVAGGHVQKDVIERMKDAFSNHGDELMDAILVGERNQKYSDMKFFTNIKDSDYDYVRQMYATAGYPEFAEHKVRG